MKPVVTVNIGSRFHLALSGPRVAAVILLVGAIVWAVWYGSQPIPEGSKEQIWHSIVGGVGVNLACVALGLALAPSPRPADFSNVAVTAVNLIAERARATGTVIEHVDLVLNSEELKKAPLAKLRLATVQEELERQRDGHVQEVALWSRVSPGSEDEIVKNRQTGAAVLKKLEKEMGDGRSEIG